MTIRFFATNRSVEDLQVSRDERIVLRENGYYFIDTTQSIGYYLQTVDTERLAQWCIVENSQAVVFDGFLGNPRIKDVIVCVHGFNVHLHEAYFWSRILSDTLKNQFPGRFVGNPEEISSAVGDDLTAIIGFSWPSDGKVLNYPSDQREAVGSGPALASLIARIRVGTGKQVHLVCHSMGNYLACNMLAALLEKKYIPEELANAGTLGKQMIERTGAQFFVDKYIMLAADVERRQVTKTEQIERDTDGRETVRKSLYTGLFHSGLEHTVREIHHFYSRFDSALKISNVEKKAGRLVDKMTLGLIDFLERNPEQKWEERLGSSPHPPTAPANFHSYNATELSGREIDHSDYVDSAALVRKIGEILSS